MSSKGKRQSGSCLQALIVLLLILVLLAVVGVGGFLISEKMRNAAPAKIERKPIEQVATKSAEAPEVETPEAEITVVEPTPTENITDEPAFEVTNATVSVSPQIYTGHCPKSFIFTGIVSVNKAGTVSYKWEKSDGTVSPETILQFDGPSSKNLYIPMSKALSGSVGAKLIIISPNNFTTDEVVGFAMCQNVGNFTGTWYTNFGTMSIAQSGSSVTGSFESRISGYNGTVAGTVTENTLTGTFARTGASGPLSLTLNADTFDGTIATSNKWCGAKTGKNFPIGCGFAGSWTIRAGDDPPCWMNITRKNNSITGEYCGGTVTGTVSYASQAPKVNGTWTNTRGGTGPFTWYGIGQAVKQFNGNYNSNQQWCGWAAGSAEPGTCLKATARL